MRWEDHIISYDVDQDDEHTLLCLESCRVSRRNKVLVGDVHNMGDLGARANKVSVRAKFHE